MRVENTAPICGCYLTEEEIPKKGFCPSHYAKQYYADNADRYATYRELVRNKCKGTGTTHYEQYGRPELERLKNQVFERYGSVCACCGEDQRVFLSIDHIQGGGTKHRNKIRGQRSGKGGGGQIFYRWLRTNGFPDGYQVLCFNCNWAKHVLGKCPHAGK